MKKPIIYLILLLFISISTFGQSKGDKIKALKIPFFTKELDLTEKEAEKFWPVYNEYYAKTSKIKRQDFRNIRREIRENANTLSDEKAKELLDKLAKAQNTLHEEETKLTNKLQKIFSPRKILLLKIAEEDFKRKILEQYKKNRKAQNK